MRGLIVAMSMVLLGGCAVGIHPEGDYPSDEFTVNRGYQEVHRIADSQPRACRQLPDAVVTGTVYSDNRTAFVRINSPAAGMPLEEVRISAIGSEESRVSIKVWGYGIWDEFEIAAMKASIFEGKPICREPQYQK